VAKKNEAYVEFKANTADFQKGIKEMNAELKSSQNALKLNATQLKGTGDSVELLSERQDLLQNELEASSKKVELTERSHAECEATLGKNSKEYATLSNAVLQAKNQQAAIQNELDQTANKLEAVEKENKEAASSFGQLADKIKSQENDLGALKKEYAELVITQGKGGKEAKELKEKITSLSGELRDNKKQLDNAENAADKFDKTLDETSDGADGLKGKLGTLALGFAGLAAAALEAGKSAIEAFNEVDEGADNVIKATGATGEAAAELETAYKNVAGTIVGDFSDIGTTLGEVNTRLGYTGEDLEWATIRFLKFSEVTGMDATTAVQDVSRAIESAGLEGEEFTNILDALTSAGQYTGISVDTLAGALTDNGAVMREMGYDTTETIAMLAQFEKAGVNSQTVTKGMQKAITNWAKDGKDAQKEFAKMVEGIQNGSVTAGDAYEVFGSKAGVELVDAIKSGRFEYEDMLGVIENSKGSLGQTFNETIDGGYQLDLAMQNCKIALADVGEVVGTALVPVFQSISENAIPAVTEAIEKMQTAFQWANEHKGVMITIASVIGVIATAITAYNVVQGVKTAMDAANVTTVWALVSAHIAQAAAAMAAIAPYLLIVAAIAAVIAIIVLCVKHWDTIKAKITEVANKVKEKVTEMKNSITEKLNAAKQKAVEIFENIKNSIREKIQAAKDIVTSIFTGITNSIKNKIETAKNIVKNVVTLIKSIFTGDFGAAKQAVLNIFDSIATGIKNKINNAKNTVKNVVDGIKKIFNFKWSLPPLKIPKISVSGGEAPFGIAGKGSLPKFSIKWNAKGGLFTKPTVLQGFGEAGHEYAIPLNERSVAPLAAMINKLTALNGGGASDLLASRFDAAVDKLADRLERLEMAVNIDGERVATATATHSDRLGGTRYELINRGLAIE
jgi:phage-related minor tail protein